MRKEIWKDVIGYEGYYEASNTGIVRSKKRIIVRSDGGIRKYKSVVLRHSIDGGGYKQVVLMKNGIAKTIKIHKIVASLFVANDSNFKIVNHINGIKTDNNYKNLEWCTYSYNTAHSYKIGRVPIHGETHNKAKLTLSDVRQIRKMYIPRKFSLKKIGDIYGVTEHAIGLIIRGKNWKHDR